MAHFILSPDQGWARLRLATGPEQAQQSWISVKAESSIEETELPIPCSDVCATAHHVAERPMKLFHSLCAGNGSYAQA